jgi:hypothetical protein
MAFGTGGAEALGSPAVLLFLILILLVFAIPFFPGLWAAK